MAGHNIFYMFPLVHPAPALSHAPFHILQNPKEIMQPKEDRGRRDRKEADGRWMKRPDGPPLVSLEHAIQEITKQEQRWLSGAVVSFSGLLVYHSWDFIPRIKDMLFGVWYELAIGT